MAISKLNAEAAVKALRGLNAGAFFSVIQANKHIFEKHGDSSKALAAAKTARVKQGYFAKKKTIFITNPKVYSGLSKTKQRRFKEEKDLKRLKPRELTEYIKNTPDLELKATSSAGEDIFNLIAMVIRSNAQGLYETDEHPDQRFLIVDAVPAGFEGKAIDMDGEKTSGLPYAAVVINATSLINPQVVTAFPITQRSLDGKIPLA